MLSRPGGAVVPVKRVVERRQDALAPREIAGGSDWDVPRVRVGAVSLRPLALAYDFMSAKTLP